MTGICGDVGMLCHMIIVAMSCTIVTFVRLSHEWHACVSCFGDVVTIWCFYCGPGLSDMIINLHCQNVFQILQLASHTFSIEPI